MRRKVVLFLLAGCTAATLAAQQGTEPPPVIFRSEVNYVEVDAIVTDAQGNVVSDLVQSDFDIAEDGASQKIASFARVEIPIARAERPLFASAPVEPDVRTNQGVEGRIYLIVLDDLHTDISRTPRVRAAARRFIESSFGANDLAAVVFTGRNDASQDFTNNPRLLLAAIDKFSGRKLQSATLNQLQYAVPRGDGSTAPGPDVDQQERAYRARAVMDSIRKLSEFMAGVRGRRKAMLLIGEGIDYDVEAVMGFEGATASVVLEDARNAIAAATRSNVAIYAIDPRGLPTPGSELIESAFTLQDQGVGITSSQNEVRLAQQSLRTLATDTGGFAVVNQNDFDSAFSRIVRENSSYYLLGYYPANDKRDGRFRKLQVRVKRPGVMVRARTGYVAPRGKVQASPPRAKDASPQAVADALNSPLPVAAVPMKVFAAAFKGEAPNAAIAFAVELDASRFDFVNTGGAWVENVEVVNTAVDTGGKAFPGDRHTMDLRLKPETYAHVRQNGLRVLGQASLPPGRYQLRFAAGTATRAGSVVYDLDVPDFSKPPLVMSGVALTAIEPANQIPTIRPKNPLGDYLPGPPVATRDFKAGDTITLFAEVYENARTGQAHRLAMKSELRSDEGRVISQTTENRSSTELQGKSGGYGFTARVPLTGLAAGLYVIHVEAQAQYGDNPTVARDVLIRVLP